MKLLIFFLIAYYAQARVVDTECEGVVIRNIVYEKEILLHIDNSPYQFAIDYDTNTLFFSFTTLKKDKIFESGYLNLKTHEFETIDGINDGFSNAVDFKSLTVYLGGNDGIYKFNYETKKAEHLNGTKDNIWQLFYKNNLYYTTYPAESVYILKNEKFERVPELTDTKALLVAIDNNENIYFSNSSGLYVHDNLNKHISYIGDYNIECFTADINGKIYFSTYNDIYYLDDSKVEKLASIKKMYSMAIEKDGNIIVGLRNTIIRLKPTKKNVPFQRKNCNTDQYLLIYK